MFWLGSFRENVQGFLAAKWYEKIIGVIFFLPCLLAYDIFITGIVIYGSMFVIEVFGSFWWCVFTWNWGHWFTLWDTVLSCINNKL